MVIERGQRVAENQGDQPLGDPAMCHTEVDTLRRVGRKNELLRCTAGFGQKTGCLPGVGYGPLVGQSRRRIFQSERQRQLPGLLRTLGFSNNGIQIGFIAIAVLPWHVAIPLASNRIGP